MHLAATLILIRHGHIDCSSSGQPLLCGSHDAPLTNRGWKQVESLKARLSSDGPVDALYCSPLRRALETAQAAPANLLPKMRVLESLAEIHCGSLEGMPVREVQTRYPESWARNEAQDDEDFGWPGGETYRRFRRRTLRAICWIARKHAGQRVVLVTHAGVVNQVLGYLAGQSAARWENFRPGNASMTIVQWCGERGVVVCFDDRSHLPD